MAKERYERSCDRDRGFTDTEIRGFIEDTKRRKAQPGDAAREAKRIAEVERRAKLRRAAPFPELAKRGTAPIVTTEADRRKWARFHGFNLVDKQIADMKLNHLIR